MLTSALSGLRGALPTRGNPRPLVALQVILLLQTNVTARVELENRLADLTDAQLGMLEQLFPRHVIEYMLSHKHGYNSRNLTHLANHHDDVIVLFTDGGWGLTARVQLG